MKPDYALLGLLARRPASGYDIGKWLRQEGRWYGRTASMTPIYRALNTLADLGWVSVRVDPRERAPDAKVYRLTEAGREALRAWAATPFQPSDRPMSPEFIVHLEFAGQLGPAYALDIVTRELEFRRAQRAAELTEEQWWDWGEPDIPEIDGAWLAHVSRIVHDRGWQSTSLFIGWLETTQRALRALVAEVGSTALESSESTAPTAPAPTGSMQAAPAEHAT